MVEHSRKRHEVDDQRFSVIKGNRCQRFLPIRNEPFCAFVIKGEEIGAPKRTDYTVGLIFIFPLAFLVKHSSRQARHRAKANGRELK